MKSASQRRRKPPLPVIPQAQAASAATKSSGPKFHSSDVLSQGCSHVGVPDMK
jgi:hypothetical protein